MSLESVFTVELPPSPYPGLRPFEKREWPIFFGRERMSDEVITRLIEKHLLVIHGDSGSGKSSLVRAAILPRLEQDSARSGICWRTCIALPGEAPLWNLAEALASLDDDKPQEERIVSLRRTLNFGPSAPEAIASLLHCGPNHHVCLLIDQFEELFAHARHHGDDDARLLCEFLIALSTTPPPGLYATLTMRSEFLGACAQYPGLAELVNATQYLLPRMGTTDLRRAIREPARLYGGSVSSELADRLIEDAGGGQDQLPLIQHGLMLMYNRRGADPAWKLTLDSYRNTGGLKTLLSGHADEVMNDCVKKREVPPEVIEKIFRALTEINAEGQALRRPQTLSCLIETTGAGEAPVRSTIEAFRAEGVSFLRPYAPKPLTSEQLIDLSHEALIRCWRRLANRKNGWLTLEFQDGLLWRALRVQAESFERDPSDVLGPAAIDERAAWFSQHTVQWAERYGGGWKRVRALIEASLRDRDRKRAQREASRRREQASERKALRMRLFAISAIAIALLAICGMLVLLARQETRKANERTQYANLQAYYANLQAEEATLHLQRLDTDTSQETTRHKDELQRAIADLETAAKTSNSNQLRGTVQNTVSLLQQQASTNPPISTGGTPRLYIQFAAESQRAAVQTLQHQLQSANREQVALIVPPIQHVTYTTRRTELRCFRKPDCEQNAQDILKLINNLLRAPVVGFANLSDRYANATNIRPGTFELWFAADDAIVLKNSSAPNQTTPNLTMPNPTTPNLTAPDQTHSNSAQGRAAPARNP